MLFVEKIGASPWVHGDIVFVMHFSMVRFSKKSSHINDCLLASELELP